MGGMGEGFVMRLKNGFGVNRSFGGSEHSVMLGTSAIAAAGGITARSSSSRRIASLETHNPNVSSPN